MSSQYYKVTRRLGAPHRNSVTVTIPLVGPAGPAGPAGPKGDPGEVSGNIAWDNVSGKPSTFPPEAHTHTADQITDFTSAVEAVSPPADWNTLANKPSTFPPSSHTHAISEVTNLQTALDGKAATSHTHAASAITSGTLDIARLPTGTGSNQVSLGNHTHTASQVTDFTTAAAAAAPVQSVNGNIGTVTVAVPAASSATPLALGTAAAGTSNDFARADHVHPTEVNAYTVTGATFTVPAVRSARVLLDIASATNVTITLNQSSPQNLDRVEVILVRLQSGFKCTLDTTGFGLFDLFGTQKATFVYSADSGPPRWVKAFDNVFQLAAPVNISDSGQPGAIAFANNYLYICIGNNDWRRVPVTTWSNS